MIFKTRKYSTTIYNKYSSCISYKFGPIYINIPVYQSLLKSTQNGNSHGIFLQYLHEKHIPGNKMSNEN